MSQPKAPSSCDEQGVAAHNEVLLRDRDERQASAEQNGLTDAQRTELARRLEDYRRDPDAGVSWESLRNSLDGLT